MRDWRERLGAWVRDPVAWGAAAAFLVAHTVYMMTLTISSPFWDSGEFIMASYTLGVPHPPGTPLYVLIGRLFSLAPLSQISARVNYMSALAASLAVLFSYLIIVDLARRWARGRETPLDRWLAVAGGLAGAFFMAFGRTFWDNAIEAEVYALSSLIMVFAVWLMLRWEASGPSNRRDPRYLILIVYLLFVGVGAHMGVLLVAPALFLYLLLVSPGTFFNRDVLAGTALVAAGVLLFALLRSAGTGFSAALLITLGAYGGTLAWRWSRLGARNLATWALAFAVLGLSVHFYLILRARLAPTLNLADPSNWENLWLVLSRDQYKPANPFEVRQASWAIQFTKHFWRYWQDQFDLGVRPQWFAQALPYLIGFLGAGTQALRDRRRFLLLLTLVFFCSVFLVFYLNFRADEVRDRDYFFVSGYHFFALWIGLGVVAVGRWLRGDPAAAAGAGGPPARAEGVAAARAGEGAPAGGVQVGAGAGGERPA
ncbi:MAG: DUF2723 domain-containing protein, partial [Candidatus Eisenbacteria bacterium]|nr:DUF2723 domain-containing protein [Candidatus Eisenbacteria bacterium]